MFRLRKLHPPFGTAEAPQWEPTYSEGMVRVVDGLCDVFRPETRDRLLKLGYVEMEPEIAAKGARTMGPKSKPKGK